MDPKMSMDLDIIILGTRCLVRIKNEESVCTNIGALQTSPPIKDTSTGLNMGKNKMNSKKWGHTTHT
jgi:hypothetical protein